MSIDSSNTINLDDQLYCSQVHENSISVNTSQQELNLDTSGNNGVLSTSNLQSTSSSRKSLPTNKFKPKSNHAALKEYQDLHLGREKSPQTSFKRSLPTQKDAPLETNSPSTKGKYKYERKPEENDSQTCRFYKKYAFCRFGPNCRFIHEERPHKPATKVKLIKEVRGEEAFDTQFFSTGKDVPIVHAAKENKTVQENSRRVCRYFRKYGNCSFGDGCKFEHVLIFQKYNQILEHEETTLKSSKSNQKIQLQNPLSADGLTQGLTTITHSDSQDIATISKHDDHHPEIQLHRPTSKNYFCRFYKRHGSCKFGEDCKFYHASPFSKKKELDLTFDKEEPKANVDEENISNIVQEEFRDNIGQTHKPQVPFQQSPVGRLLSAVQVHYLEQLTTEDLESLRQTEINQLRKRFPKCQVLQDDESGNDYLVEFMPSDPDWPFEIKILELKVLFPPQYPVKPCIVEVIDTDDRFPETLICYLDQKMLSWIENRHAETAAAKKVEMIFKPFLRWLDRNLEDMFISGLKKVKKEKEAEAAGIEFIPHEKLQTAFGSQNADAVAIPIDESENSSENLLNHSTSKEEKTFTTAGPPSNETSVVSSPQKRGTEIVLRNMQFGENAATLLCRRITVTLQCGRCKNRNDIETPANRGNKVSCTRCHHVQTLTFRPQLMHSFGCILGYLDLTGCQIVDLPIVNCNFEIGCLSCSQTLPFNGLHYGQQTNSWCSHCNSKMTIFVDSAKFQLLQPSALQGGKLHLLKLENKQKQVKDPAIQEGKPLPDNGICKHFKKSFRWLRFPCCGKAYPCDVCHDEKETDHEMKYATRMICGFCAKEQPYAKEKECILCNSNMTKKNSSHWEGGKGCRDKTKMSRDDQQKYAGIQKTVSRKKLEKNKPPTKK